MGSFYMSPVTMLVFDLCALGWLILVGLAGWYGLGFGRRRDSHGPGWRRVALVSLIQGLLGAQVIQGFALMALDPLLPGFALPWLRIPAAILFSVVILPHFVGGHVFPSPGPEVLAGAPFYALAYLGANTLGVALPQLRQHLHGQACR